ncbi:glycosyltransferase family 2 protein [Phascolarctobacterium faecium]|nr:glycosyltransferase family 2 protein [Phascolarctobacterium faecium]MDM8111174.1 glycosyltransferase family 2 protein [Phascolarctobacterium faecium]
MMNIVITMGGLGKRFQKVGYKIPKYMINVNGKTLFEWSMKSLKNFYNDLFIFVVKKEDEACSFIETKCKKLGIYDFKIVEIEHLTSGQAETVLFAEKYWNLDEKLFIYNIDTYVEENVLNCAIIKGDGFIPCFKAQGDHWSFAKIDEFGKVIEVREKNRISDNCSIGAYYFSSCKLYKEIYTNYYGDLKYIEKGEKYIAPMYNKMIELNYEVFIQNIPYKCVHVLGTPEEVENFKNANKI